MSQTKKKFQFFQANYSIKKFERQSPVDTNDKLLDEHWFFEMKLHMKITFPASGVFKLMIW